MNVILFDGICNLCNGIVLFIIKRDKKALFRFAALQSEVAQSLLKKYSVSNKQTDTIYYIRDTECLQKSTAILYILKDLSGAWKCLYPLIYIPKSLRDGLYLFVSRYRYRLFGKRQSCIIPTPEIKKRFME